MLGFAGPCRVIYSFAKRKTTPEHRPWLVLYSRQSFPIYLIVAVIIQVQSEKRHVNTARWLYGIRASFPISNRVCRLCGSEREWQGRYFNSTAPPGCSCRKQ